MIPTQIAEREKGPYWSPPTKNAGCCQHSGNYEIPRHVEAIVFFSGRLFFYHDHSLDYFTTLGPICTGMRTNMGQMIP